MTERLFISDLHLSAERPAATALFLDFLRQRASSVEELYILGDLFDAWIGDDALEPCGQSVIHGLRQLTTQGTRVLLQHGNRDFVLNGEFCRLSGAQLIAEEHVLSLNGQQCLLMHGDLLCSDDLDYQQARQWLRQADVIADFLRMPIKQRRTMVQEFRRRSGEATSLKPLDIMDVNATTVAAFMQRHQAQVLIHGHTHRPADHLLAEGKRRIVLGAWSDTNAICLQAQDDQLQLFEFSCNAAS